MRAVPVGVFDVPAQNSMQVPLSHDDHVIEMRWQAVHDEFQHPKSLASATL
jgi:hypothetical protein